MVRIEPPPFISTFLDYPDNESNAIVVYFYGCVNGCLSCQNINLTKYDSKFGIEIDLKKLEYLMTLSCSLHRTNKIVLSGGDPLAPRNWETTQQLLKDMNKHFQFAIYTGHDVEYVKKIGIKGFTFLKCGKYDASCKQISEKTDFCLQLASSNQKLYNSKYELISEKGIYKF